MSRFTKFSIVDKDSYLLELARYVVLNPLRAKVVRKLEQWQWSSYLATCGQAPKPDWLQCDFILAQFSVQRASATAKYGRRVAAMKRSVIEVGRRHLANDPEYASLLPGYGLRAVCHKIQR